MVSPTKNDAATHVHATALEFAVQLCSVGLQERIYLVYGHGGAIALRITQFYNSVPSTALGS